MVGQTFLSALSGHSCPLSKEELGLRPKADRNVCPDGDPGSAMGGEDILVCPEWTFLSAQQEELGLRPKADRNDCPTDGDPGAALRFAPGWEERPIEQRTSALCHRSIF